LCDFFAADTPSRAAISTSAESNKDIGTIERAGGILDGMIGDE